jgi:xylulokinase
MYLGIDIGTSGVKAVVLSETGAVVAQGHAALEVQRPHPFWSEQEPDEWWRATDSVVKAIDPAIRAKIQGIGLAGQMHGATLLGPDDRPLRPAILWNDGRSFEECAALEAMVPSLRSITGNLAMPGFTAPKLLWVKNREPGIFAQLRSVLLTKDYVRLCMTGDKASDMSDSAGTLWLDTGRRDWSDAVLAACGLTRDHMPQLYEGCEVTGGLRADVATRWGMAQSPVVAGAGDNAAGAAGVGVVNDGDAFISLGTSGVIFVATDRFRPNPNHAVHAFCHCIPDMWHQMSVHLSSGSCIDWAAALTGTGDAAAFFALAKQAGIANGPELFLPYLSGERTPHNDPHIRGAFLGLGNESGPAQIAAAVLEGVAFSHADGLDALRSAGSQVEEMRVIGGGARSHHWGQILAATLNVRLVYLESGEVGPALGAAKLAQIGLTGATLSEVCTAPPVNHTIEPDAELAERLAPKLARFRSAYPALKSV